ncbi:hypothetical protein N0V90_005267 [Kalmusia sp. IMI 367209]|nr:hypothetical protein N0V90_005267 [Kalmusia sp. IMI 367209]
MDRRQAFAFSQSSPNLRHQLGGASSSSGEHAVSMHPPRTHSYGAVASHFLAQPSDAFGGQTWMDFLRDPGAYPQVHTPQPQTDQPQAQSQPNLHAPLPPLPSDSFQNPSSSRYSHPAPPPPHIPARPSRSSSDRKRRLTTADSPLRRPSSIRMHSGNQSGSSEDPVIFGSSAATTSSHRPSLPTPASAVRRDSDFVLPRWQPDSEVTHCFYIVHAPQDSPNILDLINDDDDQPMSRFGPFGNPALGGGEEVRVCNPCVPDPNYSPPPQHGQTSPFPAFSPTSHSPHPGSNALQRNPRSSHRSTQSVTVGHGQAPRSRDLFTDRRTSFHGSTRVSDLWPPTQAPHHGFGQDPVYDYLTRPHSHSMLGSTVPRLDLNNFPGHSMPGSRRNFYPQTPPTPASAPPQPAPPPRRQIAEEDECPVCGNELPPKGPNGDESARTQHVEDCIAIHSGSPPPQPSTPDQRSTNQTSTSLPSQRTRGMSTATGNGEGSSNRMSLSMRGLVPYIATEKDCIDEEGKEAECVICFEEFESGDRMARLK